MPSFNRESFGKNFHWGVSTSAFQIEGHSKGDGKGPTVWDEFAKNRKNIKNGEDARFATQFINYYEDDIKLLHWMGIKNFRFSISWARIFPQGKGIVNQKGVDFYHRLIDACLAYGIKPWITLYHWDLPQALEEIGGWKNREVLKWFTDYVSFCIKEYGDKVEYWMVLNEPTAFTGLGYFMGIHAPGKKGLGNFLPAMHHAALAQAEGARIIKSMAPYTKVGTTFSFSKIEPYRLVGRDISAVKRVDALLNRLFIEPLLGLGYPLNELPQFGKVEKYFQTDDSEKLNANLDFIGVQNYSREVIRYTPWVPIARAKLVAPRNRNVRLTAMGWENRPTAIYSVLKRLSKYENIPPLIITETGIALEEDNVKESAIRDIERVNFYSRSLKSVRKAMQEGVDVQGYFAWSLTDNFEWAEGYTPRFGLVYIDYNTFKRYPKESAYRAREFLKS